MTIDINIASLLGALMLLMISIIAYFLKGIMDKISDIERDKNQTALDMARLNAQVKNLAEEQHEIRDKMRTYDNNIEAFWRDFPRMINEALASQFLMIKERIDRLEDDIKGK